jgi:DNA-binding NtrC family response regulator
MVRGDRRRVMEKRTGRVLIVEDDDALRELMHRQLASAGHRVVESDGSADVAGLLGGHEIDVVVSDVVMGARGGLHVAGEVRREAPDMPIIFVTGALSVESGALLDAARELGVRQIVAKPYETQALLDAVAAALESRDNPI